MGIWGYVGRQTGRFLLGLSGAFLLAAGVAALARPDAHSHYLGAFLTHIGQVAHLDFGTSAITATPAVDEITRGLPITFALMGIGFVVALALGISLGLLFGAGRFFRPVAPFIQVITAVPVFCAALLGVWIANVFGLTDFSHGKFENLVAHGSDLVALLRVVAIPALIAGATAAGAIQLSLHRAILGAMREPFYENMRCMGLSGSEIDRAYLMPYLLMGFFRSFGEIALSLFAADAVVEWVFGWPGAINLFVHAVALHDWNVVAIVLLVIASVVIAADFVGRIGARLVGGTAS
jgi:peptide/nickel transport system permease protein